MEETNKTWIGHRRHFHPFHWRHKCQIKSLKMSLFSCECPAENCSNRNLSQLCVVTTVNTHIRDELGGWDVHTHTMAIKWKFSFAWREKIHFEGIWGWNRSNFDWMQLSRWMNMTVYTRELFEIAFFACANEEDFFFGSLEAL